MPGKAPQVAIGQEWAYREKASSPATRVRVVRLGTRRPPRVLVRFLEEAYEGFEDWVPPTRLKVKWEGLSDWQRREDLWTAVRGASCMADDTPEDWATQAVFEHAPYEDFRMGYGRDAGVLIVDDLEATVAAAGLAVEFFTSNLLGFEDDDGTFVAP